MTLPRIGIRNGNEMFGSSLFINGDEEIAVGLFMAVSNETEGFLKRIRFLILREEKQFSAFAVTILLRRSRLR